MGKLGIVINFCTNEYRFLRPCVKAALEAAEQVIVTVCDHFFDGTEEDRALLTRAYLENPECEFLEFAYEPEKNFYGRHPVSFWHNWGRLLGYCHLKEEIDWVLFLDADEILEPRSFRDWFEGKEHTGAMRLASYWYFREPIYRAKQWEDGILVAERKLLSNSILMHHLERVGTYFSMEGSKERRVVGLHGQPMIHHYSWVRSKEEMLRKVKTWGHRDDAPWEKLVEEEFSRPFNGKDFVYGYTFDTVDNKFEISKNVRFISTEEMHKIELLC